MVVQHEREMTEANLIADAIAQQVSRASAGHCVRVNHLNASLSRDIADALVNENSSSDLTIRVLDDDSPHGITADEAVEIRNRKQGIFCLFVPAGAHDSTVSSLGNSFAEMHGSSLFASAYQAFMDNPLIANEVKKCVKQVRATFQSVGSVFFRPTTTDLLRFGLAVKRRFEADESENFGLDLWHVGLIPDAGLDFESRLRRNRLAVANISHPTRFTSSLEDRVDKLSLTPDARSRVKQLLRNQNLQDPRAWTRAVSSQPGGTFDLWSPIENPEPADCSRVSILPFHDNQEMLSKHVRGLIQGGPGEPLFAPIGQKKSLKIWWQTEPKNTNVPQWLLEIVPADEDSEWTGDSVDLPSTIIKKGSQKQGSISLDLGLLEGDEVPQAEMRVRITGVTQAGEELTTPSNERLEAVSDSFFFTNERDSVVPSVRETRRDSPTLAEGILRFVVQSGITPDEVSSPTWITGADSKIFTLRASARDVISMSFSPILDTLQALILESPQMLGLWKFGQSDAFAASIENLVEIQESSSDSDEKRAFIRARKALFAQVLKAPVRNRIQVVDWNPTLINLAIKHAQAWSNWLTSSQGHDLGIARSVDVLRAFIGASDSPTLDATIILPTHPLKALWSAAHATLLRKWSDELSEMRVADRKRAVDLDMVNAISSTNIPPLAHHPDLAEPHVFYRNIDAGHGVAFQASHPDPATQAALLSELLGLGKSASWSDGRQPQRTALTLNRFHEAHPYADPFKIALVNPDNGEFIDQSLAFWEQMRGASPSGEDGGVEKEPAELPGLVITGYTGGIHDSMALKSLDQRRRASELQVTKELSDHLRPAFATFLRPLDRIRSTGNGFSSPAEQHHLIVLQDFSQPKPCPIQPSDALDPNGLSLYGLVARYSDSLQEESDGLRWSHWIGNSGSVANHPVDRHLSDALIDCQRAAGDASARLLGANNVAGVQAGLAMHLRPDDLKLISQFHEHADWVLTVDRFLGAALFDGATFDSMPSVSRTYVLDAAPDFQDGLGHRALLTTSSRQEIESILARAMGHFGFQNLNESVGALISTLRTVSGRLVLDALRADARASEIVALGSVITWLQTQGMLSDAIIVPVDVHLDLFRPGASDKVTREQRCDLLMFRFRSKAVELTPIEVKGRSSLADLDTLVETMTAQMDSTSSVIEHRCFNDGHRVDGALQRSSLAHVLRFYLRRAHRYQLIADDKAAWMFKRISEMEHSAPNVIIRQLGFVISHKEQPKRQVLSVDDRTEVRILTVQDIIDSMTAVTRDETNQFEEQETRSFGRPVEPAPKDESSISDASTHSHTAPSSPDLETAELHPDLNVNVPPGTRGTVAGVARSLDIQLGKVNGQPVVWAPRVSGSPHLFILGIPGQGKSVTTENILIQLSEFSIPAFVLDFHGTFADPHSQYARAATPVRIDASEGLPFSPFAIDPFSSWNEVKQHARGIADVIDHVFGLGEIQADVVYTTLRDLYQLRVSVTSMKTVQCLNHLPSKMYLVHSSERARSKVFEIFLLELVRCSILTCSDHKRMIQPTLGISLRMEW